MNALYDPQKMPDRANGQPVTIPKNARRVFHRVPASAVDFGPAILCAAPHHLDEGERALWRRKRQGAA
jgi:hypothetical protein